MVSRVRRGGAFRWRLHGCRFRGRGPGNFARSINILCRWRFSNLTRWFTETSGRSLAFYSFGGSLRWKQRLLCILRRLGVCTAGVGIIWPSMGIGVCNRRLLPTLYRCSFLWRRGRLGGLSRFVRAAISICRPFPIGATTVASAPPASAVATASLCIRCRFGAG